MENKYDNQCLFIGGVDTPVSQRNILFSIFFK